jgi:hypothetical protein
MLGRIDSRYRGRTISILLAGTLVTSAIHFLDNALHLDLYPGPAWFTPTGVLLAWLPLPLFAYLAYRRATRASLIAYAFLGFAGLAHFLPMRSHSLAPRCVATVAAEAIASALLIACVLPKQQDSTS